MTTRTAKLPALSGAQLAKIAGLSARYFDKLVAGGHIPKAARGRYDTEAALKAIVNYFKSGRSETSDIASAKLKHIDATRIEIEQRTAARAKKLLPFDEVQPTVVAGFALVAQQLDGLAGRKCAEVAAESDPAKCKKILFIETRRIRHAAAEALATFARGLPGGSIDAGAGGGK